jgi:hypothetical protein
MRQEKPEHVRLTLWEKRMPALDDDWTHWWLEGENFCIGVASSLRDALDIIKRHWQRFSSIYAYRARVDSEGNIIRQEKRRAEVANALLDK